MEREGSYGKCVWRQLMIISDARLVLVEMVPALLHGWNVSRVTVQDGDAWKGYSEASIVAFKLASDDRAKPSNMTLSATLVAKLATMGVTL